MSMPQERPDAVPGPAQTDPFTARFLMRAAPDDLAAFAPDSLAAMARFFERQGLARPAGENILRVFTPSLDADGFTLGASLIATINDDRPFLVDSLVGAIKETGLRILAVFHPILRAGRDPSGKTVEYKLDAGAQGAAESMIAIIVPRLSQAQAAELQKMLSGVLSDVALAVSDWKPMLMKLAESITELRMRRPKNAAPEEIEESLKFLDWLQQNHFTFLGCRDYVFDAEGEGRLTPKLETGLGLLRDHERRVIRRGSDRVALTPEVRGFLMQRAPLIVTKSNVRSTVHRRVLQDYVGVKRYDAAGNLVGERRFVGLFTSAAYNESPHDIPFIKSKVLGVERRAELGRSSHNAKALAQVIETYPRDELFQISEDDLLHIALGRVYLGDRPRTKAFFRFDTFDRFVSALVYVPTDVFRSRLLRDFGRILSQAFNGDVSSADYQNEEGQLTRAHIVIDRRHGPRPAVSEEAIQTQLESAVRLWEDEFKGFLNDTRAPDEASALTARYADAFTDGYREQTSVSDAAIDIAKLEQILASTEPDALIIRSWRNASDAPDRLHLKIYRKGGVIELSAILPVLENFGLRVSTESSHAVNALLSGDRHKLTVHQFDCVTPPGVTFDESREAPLLEEAFLAVWRGRAESDGFNRLVLAAGLSIFDVTILRAVAKYLRQAALPFSQSLLEDALTRQPALSAMLTKLFHARLNPQGWASNAAREAEEKTLSAAIETALASVPSLDDDRIIRRYRNAIQAMLRTNAFQRETNGAAKQALAFKIDSQVVEDLPLPRPMVEIFVYSPEVEGVHLRFGRVARGGLRWSDRREDFRTEVLSLVKAQQVKNTVIVPVGSKGGFFPKRLPPASAGRDAFQAAGVAAYKTFIRCLLDVTDNLDGKGAIVPPKDVVRRDNDDPYLVVAADKGTATFSDIANGISIEYGFWLGDAFASGGSNGYDHKKMGITAKGAWETVKRHFREMGKDIQAEDFTVIGIGDMSGDVFGNGMLLSRHIKLLAAFDHRDIFLDPNPVPALSFEERKRMFNLPRSSWADYDKSKISTGGGVFSRSAKKIPLSAEVKARFHLTQDEIEPSVLMNVLLKYDADLLWFGGIGTFVKASAETHVQAGDRTNDGVRADASQLKAKVIGEGANLGLTQAARIEFARHGGRINTDAIDNSAGVDTSDHEVNLKILLNTAIGRAELKADERDPLLMRMTDEVGTLVLRDNYLQSQALSVAEFHAKDDVEAHGRMMRALEKTGRLNRAVEGLPTDETLKQLVARGAGLTRPELAVLLAYAKLELFDEINASALPDDAHFTQMLVEYFPHDAAKFTGAMQAHRLRREIIGTVLTNGLINLCGPAFMQRMREASGASCSDIVRAAVIGQGVFDVGGLARRIEALDGKVDARVQIDMLSILVRHMQRATLWALRNVPTGPIAEAIETSGAAVQALRGTFASLVSPAEAKDIETHINTYTAAKVPVDVAEDVAVLAAAATVPDIARLARSSGADLDFVAGAFFAMGRLIGIDRLRLVSDKLRPGEHWDRLAVRRISDDLLSFQRTLTARALKGREAQKGRVDGGAAVAAWGAANAAGIEKVTSLLDELERLGSFNVARLTLAASQIRDLVAD
jgi:glutamate dehydrogenase